MARTIAFDEEIAIQHAMQVFWEKGYHGASLRELTTAMRINSSSLYNTIGDKQALLLRCLEQYTSARLRLLQALAAEAPSALAAIVAIIRESATHIASRYSCLGIKSTFEVGGSDEAMRAILRRSHEGYYALVLKLVRQAMADGTLAAAGEAAVVTDYLFSLFTGWHESYLLHQDPVRISKMAALLIQQLT